MVFVKKDKQNCQFNFGFREVSKGTEDRKIVISVEKNKGKCTLSLNRVCMSCISGSIKLFN